MITVADVKCPKCGHVFNCAETFVWNYDEDGDPTVEYLRCPKCDIATHPPYGCDHAATVSFDDFVVV